MQVAIRNPSAVADEDGRLYLVFERNDEIWWAVNAGTGWDKYGKIPGASGSGPSIAYNTRLVDGVSPGLFCVWESLESPSTLVGALGVSSSEGIDWNDPQSLTSDGNDDLDVLTVITADDQPMIIWLQTDTSIEDDTDLYYQSVDIGNMAIMRTTMAEIDIEDFRSGVEECVAIKWPPGINGVTLPSWIPVIGGRHGISITGSACGAEGCTIEKSGSLVAKIEVGKIGDISGDGSVSATWSTHEESCTYVFDHAAGSIGVGGQLNFMSPPIPVIILGVPIGIAKIGGYISVNANGTLTWKNSFPSWPDADVTTTLGGGGKGEVDLLTGVLGGEADLGVTGTWDVYGSQGGFTFTEYCITLQGSVSTFWGLASRSWMKKWGDCARGETGRRIISDKNRYIIIERRIADDEVPVYEEMAIIKDTFTGTGNVYEGTPLLAGIDSDVYDDGTPAVARNDAGGILVVWTKSFPATDLGSMVYASDWNGVSWNTPVEITQDVDFNKDTSVAYDGSGNPVAVWSSASNDGLDYNLATIEEIADATGQSDIYFSRRIDGVWSTPQVVSPIIGKDEKPVVFSDPEGHISLAWLNDSGSEVSLYISSWDGSAWSSPEIVSSAVFMEKVVLSDFNGSVCAIWTQDTDGDIDTTDDWQLFYSIRDASGGSEALPIEIADSDSDVTTTEGAGRYTDWRRYFNPPEDCCEDEEEKEPKPPIPLFIPVFYDTSDIVRPTDPNEKVAFGGVGPDNYIDYGSRIRYFVYFENKADADVPAQEVFITDNLPDTFDFSTLRLESVAFGNVIVTHPENTAFFETAVVIPDYRDGNDKQWKVDILTEFDLITRRFKATLRTIDPETGDLPEDVYAGFLPPEDGSGRGQGYIAFSVETKEDLTAGAVISNKASIIFDTNDPIETNTVFNTARYTSDVNDDHVITLADTITALKTAAGMIDQNIIVESDVNGDGSIGLEEAVYSLQIIAGARN